MPSSDDDSSISSSSSGSTDSDASTEPFLVYSRLRSPSLPRSPPPAPPHLTTPLSVSLLAAHSNHIALVRPDNTVCILPPNGGESLYPLIPPPTPTPFSPTPTPTSLSFNSTGTCLLITYNNGSSNIFDIDPNLTLIHSYTEPSATPSLPPIYSVTALINPSFSADTKASTAASTSTIPGLGLASLLSAQLSTAGSLSLLKKSTNYFYSKATTTLIPLHTLPQTTPDEFTTNIPSIAWHDDHLCLATCTTVNLYRIDATRNGTAHARVLTVDIPGSLSKIYKHIRTHVTFDTPTSLLVAAADCLMSVDVTKNACTMAWEMDVVALGVCPLDSQNVQVCGLVKEAAEEGSSGRENMFGGVEMQVIERATGTVIECDFIPLAVPDALAHPLKPNQYSFVTSNLTLAPWQNWSLHSYLADSPATLPSHLHMHTSGPPPSPVMCILSPHDLINTRVIAPDDRVQYSVKRGEFETALERGLRDVSSLKRVGVEELGDLFLKDLLEKGEEGVARAAKETERLLGSNRERWEKWLYGFSKSGMWLGHLLPYLPVRDPVLNQSLYEMALEKMLLFAELQEASETGSFEEVYVRMVRSWGKTSAGWEYVRFCQSVSLDCSDTVRDLGRRCWQSSKGYLEPNTPSPSPPLPVTEESAGEPKGAVFSILAVRNRVEARVGPAGKGKRVDLYALAELHRMTGEHESSIACYERIGKEFCATCDDECLRMVIEGAGSATRTASPFEFVLPYIDKYGLSYDVVALTQLVGVRIAAEFLVDRVDVGAIFGDSLRPKVLLWLLELSFQQKLEVYAKLPFHIHERHLSLLIQYSAEAVRKNPGTRLWGGDSPLLVYLRTMLKKGGVGVRADDARAQLSEVKSLPRELGFVRERSEAGEDDARGTVELYLRECGSVFLAVQFAEAHAAYREVLWEVVVAYCLENEKLGELLECAASIGSDLSTLVAKIPRGMEIDDLKGKLLGSIESYRVRVGCHGRAMEVSGGDRLELLRKESRVKRVGRRVSGGQKGAGGGASEGEGAERRRARRVIVRERLRTRDRSGRVRTTADS